MANLSRQSYEGWTDNALKLRSDELGCGDTRELSHVRAEMERRGIVVPLLEPQLSAAAFEHLKDIAEGLVDEQAGLDGCELCNEIRAYVIATNDWIVEAAA